jgi:hypothetical protein
MSYFEKEKCRQCNGDGWTVEHHQSCAGNYGRECDCGGEQVPCEYCLGAGEIDV